MNRATLIALDLAAIIVLVFVLYFPRHRRKDMVVAYLGVNIGVLGVAQALSSATVGAGLGLGLFGVCRLSAFVRTNSTRRRSLTTSRPWLSACWRVSSCPPHGWRRR